MDNATANKLASLGLVTLGACLADAGKAAHHVSRKTRHGEWLRKRYAAVMAPASTRANTVAG